MTESNSQDLAVNKDYHWLQSQLCSLTFFPPQYSSDRILVATAMNVYYDPHNPTWFKCPNWLGVVGLSDSQANLDRDQGYYVWQEGRRPNLVMEFLPTQTQEQKYPGQPTIWEVYEQILGIPFYVVFDYTNNNLKVFKLVGDRYRKQELTNHQFWFAALDLGIGLWQGEYQGLRRWWLRWYDSRGNWIPIPDELDLDLSESTSLRDKHLHNTPSKLGKHLQNLGVTTHHI